MAKIISEKTLELNVTAELLQVIRSWPGCAGAYWVGMKQDQETRNGLDELIRNAPDFCLMLQFKSPWRDPVVDPFRFEIKELQLNRLRLLSNLYPEAVYYVFPKYNRHAKIRATAPNLLHDTWFLRVADLDSVGSSNTGKHRVDVYGPPVVISSEPTTVQAIPGASFIRFVDIARQNVAKGLQPRDVMRWAFRDKRQTGKKERFRSLGIICVQDQLPAAP